MSTHMFNTEQMNQIGDKENETEISQKRQEIPVKIFQNNAFSENSMKKKENTDVEAIERDRATKRRKREEGHDSEDTDCIYLGTIYSHEEIVQDVESNEDSRNNDSSIQKEPIPVYVIDSDEEADSHFLDADDQNIPLNEKPLFRNVGEVQTENDYQTLAAKDCYLASSSRDMSVNYIEIEYEEKDDCQTIAAKNNNLPSNANPLFNNYMEINSETEDDYQKLAALNNLDLVSNTEPFECPLCIEHIAVGKGVVLHDCLHNFCKGCLAEQIQNSNKALVRCPFQNLDYNCESHLQDREIKSIVSAEEYKKHVQNSVRFHCQTPGCSGSCPYEDYESEFLCQVCGKNNCVACAAIHEGITCNQYQGKDAISETSKKLQQPAYNVEDAGAEKKPDYVALEEASIVTNVESFECPICFTNIEVGEGVILHDCLHNFCKVCLIGLIQHSETALVKCPFLNDEYACESHLREREIKSLVTNEMYEKHLQRSVTLAESQAPDSFHCKTADCPGWCLYEDDVNNFCCPVCSKNNCLSCAAIHEGRNCKQYQDFLDFNCNSNEEARRTKEYLQDMLKKKQAKECPRCHIIIIKKGGCDHMKCMMCKHDFWWSGNNPLERFLHQFSPANFTGAGAAVPGNNERLRGILQRNRDLLDLSLTATGRRLQSRTHKRRRHGRVETESLPGSSGDLLSSSNSEDSRSLRSSLFPPLLVEFEDEASIDGMPLRFFPRRYGFRSEISHSPANGQEFSGNNSNLFPVNHTFSSAERQEFNGNNSNLFPVIRTFSSSPVERQEFNGNNSNVLPIGRELRSSLTKRQEFNGNNSNILPIGHDLRSSLIERQEFNGNNSNILPIGHELNSSLTERQEFNENNNYFPVIHGFRSSPAERQEFDRNDTTYFPVIHGFSSSSAERQEFSGNNSNLFPVRHTFSSSPSNGQEFNGSNMIYFPVSDEISFSPAESLQVTVISSGEVLQQPYIQNNTSSHVNPQRSTNETSIPAPINDPAKKTQRE